MKKHIMVVIIIFLGLLEIAWAEGAHGYTSRYDNNKECIEPQNPYNDGGGHDAGFNWAMENGRDCNGKSNSFNEGCEEYYRQLNQYNECIANNSK